MKKTIKTLLVTCIIMIKLPKTSAYVKSCNGQTKWMYFLTDNDLWKNIILFGINDSKPVYNKKFLKI